MKKLKYGPTLISFEYLDKSLRDGNTMSPDGKKWYPARYVSFTSFIRRLQLAYLVFMGYYDAFKWPEEKS